MQRNRQVKEFGLYVHIPFCVQKCRYCDFLSAPAPEDVRRAYSRKLQEEIAAAAEIYRDCQVTSIFIGGGTPSLLSVAQASSLMGQLRNCFLVRENAEITIECNPETLYADKLEVYHRLGINRLSIGLQSADAAELELLGRIHTYEKFVQAYQLAREAGFANINVDVMAALPGQTVSAYAGTVRKLIALRPEHISAYSLMIEEGTAFYERYHQAELLREKGREQHALPSEEEERSMYSLTKELLEDAGYQRYEISNYALDGFSCRHNIGYWTRRNYLGLGLGAASMVENTRFCNTKDMRKYLALDFSHRADPSFSLSSESCPPWSEDKECLSVQAQMEEFMFLGLRMMRGVSAQSFACQFGKRIEEVYGTVIEKQLCGNLIRETAEGYCLTDYGIDVSNYVMSAYLFG